jgi:DNA polymerase I-like protein with 3'-5' exonuclease and polymerase domains
MHNLDFEVLCISWAWEPDVGYMAHIDQIPPVVWDWIRDKRVLKVGHNIKYDAKALSLHLQGLQEAQRVDLWPFHDTRHMWGLLDESATEEDRAAGKDYVTIYPSLKVLARRAGIPRWTSPEDRFFGEHGASTKAKGAKFMAVWDKLPRIALLYPYAAMDAVASWVLHDTLLRELSPAESQHLEFLMRVERTLITMELNGLHMDVAAIDHELATRGMEAARLTEELQTQAGIANLASGPQAATYLYDTLGCPEVVPRTTAGARPTHKEALASLLAHPTLPDTARTFLEKLAIIKGHTAVLRQLNVYSAAIRDDGRIHASFNLSGTRTGRTSSAVNVQNPARTGPIRSCFTSRFPEELST